MPFWKKMLMARWILKEVPLQWSLTTILSRNVLTVAHHCRKERDMSATSTIEWTQSSWNPISGCTEVSPGCDHCYARTFAERFRGVPGHPYEQGFDLRLWPERFEMPIYWKNPRRVFVNSMSDLMHKDIPDEFILRVFETMAERAAWHTYQVLTKRPSRLVNTDLLRKITARF